MRWDEHGIDILGKVKVSAEREAFFQFPLRKDNLRYLRRTTGTAMLVQTPSLPSTETPLTYFRLGCIQPHLHHWLSRLDRLCQAKCSKVLA